MKEDWGFQEALGTPVGSGIGGKQFKKKIMPYL